MSFLFCGANKGCRVSLPKTKFLLSFCCLHEDKSEKLALTTVQWRFREHNLIAWILIYFCSSLAVNRFINLFLPPSNPFFSYKKGKFEGKCFIIQLKNRDRTRNTFIILTEVIQLVLCAITASIIKWNHLRFSAQQLLLFYPKLLVSLCWSS